MKLLLILGAVIIAAVSIWGCAPRERLVVFTGPGQWATYQVSNCSAHVEAMGRGKFRAVCAQ